MNGKKNAQNLNGTNWQTSFEETLTECYKATYVFPRLKRNADFRKRCKILRTESFFLLDGKDTQPKPEK